jgi:hypothetical protein
VKIKHFLRLGEIINCHALLRAPLVTGKRREWSGLVDCTGPILIDLECTAKTAKSTLEIKPGG